MNFVLKQAALFLPANFSDHSQVAGVVQLVIVYSSYICQFLLQFITQGFSELKCVKNSSDEISSKRSLFERQVDSDFLEEMGESCQNMESKQEGVMQNMYSFSAFFLILPGQVT